MNIEYKCQFSTCLTVWLLPIRSYCSSVDIYREEMKVVTILLYNVLMNNAIVVYRTKYEAKIHSGLKLIPYKISNFTYGISICGRFFYSQLDCSSAMFYIDYPPNVSYILYSSLSARSSCKILSIERIRVS